LEIDFEKEINYITRQIIEKYKPEKIILFGSAARGELNLNSDADFLIIKKETPLLKICASKDSSLNILR